jgi:hypothetical protein
LNEVEVWVERRRGTGVVAGAAKPPKFDGATLWVVFGRQFQTVKEHNCWTHLEKSTYLVTALQGRATDVLHGVPKGTIYDETLEALEDRFEEKDLAVAYRSQLKTRTQAVGEPSQEFERALERLGHPAYPALR